MVAAPGSMVGVPRCESSGAAAGRGADASEHLSAGLSEQDNGALCCHGAEGNLPIELTTFVGRHNELAEARRLLGSARLVP